MPPVVGMSEAVMPTRITLSADAAPIGRMLRKAATATHPKIKAAVFPLAGSVALRVSPLILPLRGSLLLPACGERAGVRGRPKPDLSFLSTAVPPWFIRLPQEQCQQKKPSAVPLP